LLPLAHQVRARAAELRGSLVEVVTTLADSPHLLHWDSILKKFSSINLQVSESCLGCFLEVARAKKCTEVCLAKTMQGMHASV